MAERRMKPEFQLREHSEKHQNPNARLLSDPWSHFQRFNLHPENL
jgi:hypothetical protein